MARRPSSGPTDAELEILHVLWRNGPSTVREVCDALNEIRRTGYTTALKLLQIMTEKGLVQRDESRRTHVYLPSTPRDSVQKSVLGSLIDKLFDGSSSQLVLYALQAQRVSPQEIDEIRRLLDTKREDVTI
ncbi:MAG: BlaI/MecI/CopY family transcriptional regulator [Candidatus Hydrogenedentes bacterium]|nr:BlaI/MecI/CopY family transcriptional regulator [Candidatus Hydrogenedentota bacterium]